jgi:hypothetical protein
VRSVRRPRYIRSRETDAKDPLCPFRGESRLVIPMPGLLPRWITLSDHRGLFGNSVARAEYESHGAVKTLDPEWLRTGNRNLLRPEI